MSVDTPHLMAVEAEEAVVVQSGSCRRAIYPGPESGNVMGVAGGRVRPVSAEETWAGQSRDDGERERESGSET